VAGELVQIRRHAGKYLQNPWAIEAHTLRLRIQLRVPVNDHFFATLSPCQPVDAPAQDLHLVCQAVLEEMLQGSPCTSGAATLARMHSR